MEVRATTDSPAATPADTIAVGLFEDEGVTHDSSGGELQALRDSGEARSKFKSLALAHADGKRWLVVGLGERSAFDPERARVAAAIAAERAGELSTRILAWELPHDLDDVCAAALVEGTVLAAYRFDAFKSKPAEPEPEPPRIEQLLISAHHDVSEAVALGHAVAEAANAARDLQNAPANVMTPARLGERARELAAQLEGLEADVQGREQIVARGMGAFASVAQGTDTEPALITLRYDGPGASGPRLGFVGKAVTFDTGGISLKPGARMSEMKFDMSGGAAVIEAVGAIARLRLPLSVVAVIGATENMPSGHATRPGDIVTAMNGRTIEVNNTDAEGRLVLADCLAYAIELGAERLVDLATLTGAIIIALGNTHAGLFSNDDDWATALIDAGRRSGEILWRLPLHEEYADLIKGRYGDLDNAPEERKAGSIVAAQFLANFVDDVPWAHVDIAGSAWNLGRAYSGKGASGYGVHLLIALARGQARANAAG